MGETIRKRREQWCSSLHFALLSGPSRNIVLSPLVVVFMLLRCLLLNTLVSTLGLCIPSVRCNTSHVVVAPHLSKRCILSFISIPLSLSPHPRAHTHTCAHAHARVRTHSRLSTFSNKDVLTHFEVIGKSLKLQPEILTFESWLR